MINKIRTAYKQSFIKHIMMLIFIFSVLFIILFVGMTYFTTRSNLVVNIKNTMDVSSRSAASALDGYIRGLVNPLKSLAADSEIINYASQPADSAQNDVISELQKIQEISGVTAWCISDYNGSAVVGDGTVQKIITDDYKWYNEVRMSEKNNPKLYLKSSEYSSFLALDSSIMVIIPVYNNDEFSGCVGVEASVNPLESVINENIFSDGVYPVVFDQQDNIVCIPKHSKVFDELLNGTDGAFLEALNGIEEEYDTGKTVHYITRDTTSYGWKICITYDGMAIEKVFSEMYLQQIIILACLFVIQLVATLNVIRHESKDIPEISSSIAEISAGNYNFRINSKSENEIGLIAKSVDNLAQALQDKNAVIDDYRNLDPTTGLQNRYKMYEYIEDLMVSRDDSRKRFALLFIDIDNFKWITETLGHRQGDEFLKIFGQRLKSVVSRVFRFSGDEFIILTEFNDDYGIIDELIANLRAEFRRPIEILNDKLYVQFSVGISIFPDDDTNADMLLRDADIAVSRSKEKGKGRTSYYSASLHNNVVNKVTIGQKLNKALENNEMFLNFQPIVSVSNGDIHGFEVLIRWESEELGNVSPSTFVQIAEETGAIVEIGTWIFETACRYLKSMCEYNSDIVMSINVSSIQLRKSDFLDKVKRTINVFGINPANIQIEITETSLVEFIDGGNNVIQKLSDMGISIALDDFGTGYSSFGYLKDMPIKCLKVDKSFVDEICSKHKDYQITGSIIDMVRNLGIKTVVEGVETIEQYNILSEMKCDYIQGFLMSKPLNASDAMEFLISYNELHKPSQQSLEESSSRLAAEREKRTKVKEK